MVVSCYISWNPQLDPLFPVNWCKLYWLIDYLIESLWILDLHSVLEKSWTPWVDSQGPQLPPSFAYASPWGRAVQLWCAGSETWCGVLNLLHCAQKCRMIYIYINIYSFVYIYNCWFKLCNMILYDTIDNILFEVRSWTRSKRLKSWSNPPLKGS